MAVFDAGQVLQVGARDEVFNRPASARVARLTEVRNIWRGRVTDTGPASTTVDVGAFALRAAPGAWNVGDVVDVCIRPERVIVLRPERLGPEAARDAVVTADVVEEIAHGASYTLLFRVAGSGRDGYDVEVDLPAHPYEVMGVRDRRTWALAFPREALHVMPAT